MIDGIVIIVLGIAALFGLQAVFHLLAIFRMTAPTPKPARREYPKRTPPPHILCDKCYAHKMLFNGIVPEPGTYQHECPCGHRLNLRGLVYVPKKTEDHAT